MNLCLVLTYLISIFRNTTAVEALWGYTTPKPINHNYTQCCIDESVPNECLGFCSIKNILEGTTGNKVNEWNKMSYMFMYFILQISGIHPTKCDPHFKQIVHCMADGRNHVPCCERNQVPDICQDMCIGMKILQI